MNQTTERRPARLTRWKPKSWRPEYEKMVYLSVRGWGNKRIGDALGYTKEHVSSVLNLDQADELREKFIQAMRASELADVPQTLQRIAEKTADRLLRIVENDELFEKSPFAVVGLGMDVVKGLGHLRGGGNGAPVIPTSGNTIIHGNVVAMSDELMSKFFGGLDVANKARELNKDDDFGYLPGT